MYKLKRFLDLKLMLLLALVFTSACLDIAGSGQKTSDSKNLLDKLVGTPESASALLLPDKPKTSEQPPALPDDDALPLPPEGGSGGSVPLFG
ncbi:hypothetical protein HYX10_02230 [Candidatus Woesearchaeota archaeon]|nr:hypothetical protein [Candidatus Woesearchaeota archaeon]